MARAGRPAPDRTARAHRILDVAADLVVRWGYDKTTIDDVARRAGVAKGTIYLHWRTRDDLFAALLRRERVLMMEEARASAPAGLGELLGSFVGTALRRPLLRAVLVGDADVIGKLARTGRRGTMGLEMGGVTAGYLQRLADRGAVRRDPGDHLAVITAVVHGFVSLPGLLPGGSGPSDRRIAELVADTVERTLGTGRTLPVEDARAVARVTSEYLDTLEVEARHRLDASLAAPERVP